MAEAKRDLTADALRGLGIAIIVLSHAVTEASVAGSEEAMRLSFQSLLYVMNVQVLSFVSGLLVRRVDLRPKLPSLLVPMGVWLTLFNLPYGASLPLAVATAPSGIPGLFTAESPLWFLWALFASFVLAKVLNRHRRAMILMACLLAIVWPVLPSWTLIRGMGLVFPFMILGALTRRALTTNSLLIRKYWPLLLVGAVCLGLVGTHLMGGPVWAGTVLPADRLPVEALLAFAGALGCLGLLGVARSLDGVALRAAAFLGTGSLGIYGFHWLLIVLLPSTTRARSLSQIFAMWLILLTTSTLLTAVAGRFRFARSLLLGGRGPLYPLLLANPTRQEESPATRVDESARRPSRKSAGA